MTCPSYKVCRPGDLVMNRMQAWSGMFAVSRGAEGLVSPDYSVYEAIEPSEIKHFEHLFKTPVVVDQFALGVERYRHVASTDSTRRISVSYRLWSTPLPEQAAIVRFLDHADRRIRRYIRAKEKLTRAVGGAEAGHHPRGRHGPDRRPHREAIPGLQTLRGRVAGGSARTLGGASPKVSGQAY